MYLELLNLPTKLDPPIQIQKQYKSNTQNNIVKKNPTNSSSLYQSFAKLYIQNHEAMKEVIFIFMLKYF